MNDFQLLFQTDCTAVLKVRFKPAWYLGGMLLGRACLTFLR